MKILILILGSNDSEHESDLVCQKNTWISNLNNNVEVIILRGWDKDYFHFNNDTLFVPCKEDYSLILKKTIMGIKYISDNFDFDILVRTNVSTYFETHRLMMEISKPKYKASFYGGYFDKSKQKVLNYKKSFEYISGTGIFLSRDIATLVGQLPVENYLGVFDDVAISHYLNEKGISKLRIARNNLHSTHLFIPTFHIRTKNTFDSKSASRRMILIHTFFSQKSFSDKTVSIFKLYRNELKEFTNGTEKIYKFILKNRIILVSFVKLKISRFK